MDVNVQVTERREGSAGVVLALVLVVLLIAGVVTMGGCESPAAQRERARAERALAEAQAYQTRQQADTAAAAERAAIREAAREAGHQRALEMLPYVLVMAGIVTALCLGALVLWYLVLLHRERTLADARSRRCVAGGQSQSPIVHILILPQQPSEQKRAEYWREVSAAAARQELVVGE